jgi:preprotein translocase subunit Sec61beta
MEEEEEEEESENEKLDPEASLVTSQLAGGMVPG